MSNIKKIIQARIDSATSEVIDQLYNKVVELHYIPRYWEAFEGRTTTRKNPNAPMRVVGAIRDNIDSYEMVESVRITPDGLGVEIAVPYAQYVLSEKPIMEVALEELDFTQLFEDALES